MRAPSQGYPSYYNTTGTRGAVACELDVCSNVGAYILEKGGSAADAMIATLSCVGVMDSFHSGLSGGGFALVKTRYSDPVMIDYRETAPQAAHRDMYAKAPPNSSIVGGLAVAVPGEVRGWEQLHRLYGRLPWEQLLEPSIVIARRGFRVPAQLYSKIQWGGNLACLAPTLVPTFCPDGEPLPAGSLLRLPALADTLEQIATYGPNVMYEGPIAERMIETIQQHGGIMTMDDLRQFQVRIGQAASIDFRDKYRVWTTTAPSSGSVILSTLKTMEQYPDEPYYETDALHTHRFIEATKFSYGERTFLADPAFLPNVTAWEEHIIQPSVAKKRFDKIRDDTVRRMHKYDPQHWDVLSDKGTSHLNAVDAEGMSISVTTTINGIWGAFLSTPDGILLNNDMDDFSQPDRSNLFGYAPSPANYIAPGKRPMSSMSPFLIENRHTGEVEVIGGSAGGSRIITANLLLAYTYMSFHGQIDMQSVIDRPRWHHQLVPDLAFFEYEMPTWPFWHGYSNRTVEALQAKGHHPYFFGPGVSTAQAIVRRPDGHFVTASEVRQEEARGAAV
ncbi:glutathione hydrolase [Malassezia pachydermatis]